MIDITLVPLPSADADLAAFNSLLDANEISRAQGFRRADDARRFVVARAVLRSLLGKRLGLHAADVVLTTIGRGKPVLADPHRQAWSLQQSSFQPSAQLDSDADESQLHFNVSHAGEWIVLALAPYPVGIDVEQVRAINTAALGAEVFDEQTRKDIEQAPDALALFFHHWTRQEALWKAHGIGLAGASASISAAMSTSSEAPDSDSYVSHIQSFDVAAGYYAAVCVLDYSGVLTADQLHISRRLAVACLADAMDRNHA